MNNILLRDLETRSNQGSPGPNVYGTVDVVINDSQIPGAEVRLLTLTLMNAERMATEGLAKAGADCLQHGLALADTTVRPDLPYKLELIKRWETALARFCERHHLNR